MMETQFSIWSRRCESRRTRRIGMSSHSNFIPLKPFENSLVEGVRVSNYIQGDSGFKHHKFVRHDKI